MDNFTKDMLFSKLTTLKIGGLINYYVEINSLEELQQSLKLCQSKKIQPFVIGSGSNLLVADEGFDGVVIKNNIQSIEQTGEGIIIGVGTVLQTFINWANQKGYAGFEKLAGIPGTVGGAVYGNAGAYGQTISDNLVWAEIINVENLKTEKLSKSECEFAYRESKFKHSAFIITKVAFVTLHDSPDTLIKTSSEVIAAREQKYYPEIKCPGSFFKNVEVLRLSPSVLADIPKDKIMHGKIPAGWLLESVGAKGDGQGDIRIAPHHGNLFFNAGNGTARDFVTLAEKYQQKVYERFGIMLEPEVQLIGFKEKVLK